ncbi:hypothetical protein PILCRDRAFT_89122 [Piloderma croceum F 1598]|uniref:Uncharacterized protein n=1 Tax=Piloderma croceum (strain F 1598) TaxID=765440 RepID=A0A0C3BVH5_PILCF|nr:hypothetical protein PILCRDRAFT_89122 [Piloderma croceum F 1598]
MLSFLPKWLFNHSQLKIDLQTLKHWRHTFEDHLRMEGGQTFLGQDVDPFTDHISNTILNTVLSFPVPRIYQPVWPWLNDAERIIQHHVLTKEPQMKALITELDGANQVFLDDAANQMQAQLPLLPGFFKDWELEKWVD